MKQEILPYIFCLPYSAFPFCFRPQQYSCNALCSLQLKKQLASYSTVIFTCLSHTDTDESYSSELNWSQRSTAQGYCLQPNTTCIRHSPGSVSSGVRKSASPSLPPKCFGIGWSNDVWLYLLCADLLWWEVSFSYSFSKICGHFCGFPWVYYLFLQYKLGCCEDYKFRAWSLQKVTSS